MTRLHGDNRAALAALIARFQPEVQRLALAAVREILQQELARKRSAAPKTRAPVKARTPAKGRPPAAAAKPRAKTRAAAAAAATAPATPAHQQLSLAGVEQPPPTAAEQAAAAAAAETAAAPPPAGATEAKESGEKPSVVAPGVRKRARWTRESIIHELASWMSGGTAIDAVFVQRYGPPGLVAATRRVFGRFDAALNVASLHRAKLNESNSTPERT